jgi:hypothetical protein
MLADWGGRISNKSVHFRDFFASDNIAIFNSISGSSRFKFWFGVQRMLKEGQSMQIDHRSSRRGWGRRFGSLLSVLLALEIATGCALFWKEPVPPPSQRIAIRTEVNVDDDGDLEGDLHGDTTVKGMFIGLGAGAVTGGGLGFWWGAAGCVTTGFLPLYPLCVALSTVAGVVIGGPTGAVIGGTTGLPWKAAGEVNEILAEVEHKRDLTKEFPAAVKAAMRSRKQVSERNAQAIVTARLDEVDLRQHLRQRMSLRMRASMT